MTREALPTFDLYAELEVSRSASVAAIERAYRRLAKLHHPDAVAGAGRGADGDDARIKRLNTARDWLTDPDRRARYDRITGARPAITMSTAGGNRESRPRARTDAVARGGGVGRREQRDQASWASFGSNAAEVRRFLAELREIDYARALEVRGGIQAATAGGREAARSVAYEAGRSGRLSEWLFARDAAAVIVRTRLGDVELASEIVEPLADAAGAIAIRDRLPDSDVELLLLPWTWRGDHILGRPVMPRSMAAIVFAPRHGRPRTLVRAASATRAMVAARTVVPLTQAPSAAPIRAPKRQPKPARVRTGSAIPWARIGRRVPIVAASASALALVVVFVALGSALLNGGPRIAVVAGATDVPSASIANLASVPAPTLPSATPAPSSTPLVAAIDPAKLQGLRAGVSSTLATLRSAAAQGDVVTAQPLLGASAPGLRSSGLLHATFPDPAPSDIDVEPAGSGWTATVGSDTLASADGSRWTLDYGDRPLAQFGSKTVHTLYFNAPASREINVTMSLVVISRSSVTLGFRWTYGPDSRYGNDGPYFAGAQLVVSSFALGRTAMPLPNGVVAELGTPTLTGSILVPGDELQPATVRVVIAVVQPNGDRLDTPISLTVR